MAVVKLKNDVRTFGLMSAVSSFSPFNSSSRIAMLSNHLEQTCSPMVSDIPRILTGFESQLKAFDIRMPCDARIVSVHHKYRTGFGSNNKVKNSCITIIFQNQENGVYDTLDITGFNNKHSTYGTEYILQPIVKQLRAEVYLEKGTVLARNPCTKEGDIFTNSLSCNTINLSVPATIEDGYVISKSLSERGALLELPVTTGSWGRKTYLLNTYGDENNFKGFPDVGDKIREDGLVFAFREYNENFDAILMSAPMLMEVDMIHDIRVYGVPGAEVFEVEVESGIGESTVKPNSSPYMSTQPERYIKQLRDYYNSLIDTNDNVLSKDKNMNMSPRLINLITRAYADRPNNMKIPGNNSGIIRRVHKGIPLDEYRVTIKAKHRMPLARGSKITGKAGNKGVVIDVWDDTAMPRDSDGNVADVIKFFKSTVSRLNCGQLYNQYIAAASRDLSKWVRLVYNLPSGGLNINHYLGATTDVKWVRDSYNSQEGFDVIWDRILSYYEVTSPIVFKTVSEYTRELKLHHVNCIFESGIYLIIPPDSPNLNKDIFHHIESVVSPTRSVVIYTALNGKQVTTKTKAFIGVEDIIILEKSDLHPMAASSGLVQHHGLLAGSSKVSVNAHPSKVQSVKAYSETEVRLYEATTPSGTASKLLNLSNNPEAHKQLIKSIIDAPTPGNIGSIAHITNGGSRALSFIKSVLYGFGISLKSVIKKLK